MRTIDAHSLTLFQRCKRRWLLSQSGYPEGLRWNPNSLFSSIMRRAVSVLSSGKGQESVATAARTDFIDAARSPGLDVENCDVYKLAMDYCAIITNIIEALSRVSLLTTHPLNSVLLTEQTHWKFLSQADDSGMLHRWLFPDSWTDDDFTRELHSWYTFGDIAAAPAPMQLHIIEIGRRSSGRMISPWSRAHKHPIIAGRFKFENLQGDKWKPMFFADSRFSSEEWVTQMQREGLTQKLIHHATISEPKPEHIKEFVRQVESESAEMRRITATVADAMELPMSRSACDFPRPCPFRSVCYR